MYRTGMFRLWAYFNTASHFRRSMAYSALINVAVDKIKQQNLVSSVHNSKSIISAKISFKAGGSAEITLPSGMCLCPEDSTGGLCSALS